MSNATDSRDRFAGKFSAETPEALIEVLGVVGKILINPFQPFDLPIVSWSGHKKSVQGALDVAQEVVNADWVRQSRVRWIELLLKDEESQLKQKPDLGRCYDPHHTPFEPYLRPRYVGSDLNRLLDRWLDIMSDMRRLTENDGYIRKEMATVISRRTNCIRPGDPHRDETVRDMLREKYGLDD